MILPVMPYALWSVLGPGEMGGVGSHPRPCDTPAPSSHSGPGLTLASRAPAAFRSL